MTFFVIGGVKTMTSMSASMIKYRHIEPGLKFMVPLEGARKTIGSQRRSSKDGSTRMLSPLDPCALGGGMVYDAAR